MSRTIQSLSATIFSVLVSTHAFAECPKVDLAGLWGDEGYSWNIKKSASSGYEGVSRGVEVSGCWGITYVQTTYATLQFDPQTCILRKKNSRIVDENNYKGGERQENADTEVDVYKVLEYSLNGPSPVLVYAACKDDRCEQINYQWTNRLTKIDPKIAHLPVCPDGYLKNALGCVSQIKKK